MEAEYRLHHRPQSGKPGSAKPEGLGHRQGQGEKGLGFSELLQQNQPLTL